MAGGTQAARDRVTTGPKPTRSSLKKLKQECEGLRRKNLKLELDLEDAQLAKKHAGFDEKRERLTLTVRRLEIRDKANEVIRLVQRGISELRLREVWCRGFDPNDLEQTMKWFRSSKFEGNLALLRWAVKNNEPRALLDKEYASGKPNESDAAKMGLDADQEAYLTAQGLNVRKIRIAAKVSNIADYKRQVAKMGA